MIHRLSDGDITRAESVTAMPYITCLVWLSYEKEVLKK
jgi:hypothetical protein